jgi:hypothetical protein
MQSLRSTGYSANLTDVTPISDNMARVAFTVASSAKPADMMKAVAGVAKNAFPVNNSFTVISDNGLTKCMTGIMVTQSERVVLNDTNRDNFKAVAGNLYLDEEESMWNMTRSEAGEIMIRANSADEREVMEQLMKSVASSTVYATEAKATAQALIGEMNGLEGGDLIHFVNGKGVATAGVILAEFEDEPSKVVALSSTSLEHEMINRNQIIAAVKASEVNYDEEEAIMSVASTPIHSLDHIADYYRKMFQRDPSYFEKFWQRFTSHVFA